ncbi:guanylate cyclase [Aliishimia ponticola]|uniref:Guanylate cyclase n=1 Tax=Aliishimia ponticola TaxID=2499833 RepID=A0A4S4NB17_9RHOB|nr:heme NO-binding domain-containing protein [Aliishimia ponticola]THH35161.1 guanylate cyclase [Aliishimia ponticola]
MKGVIFTELMAMAEENFGEEAVDAVIEAADLPSGGAYTSVGNYPCEELLTLVGGFSAHSGLPAEELQRLFGHWIMDGFERHYPQFFVTRNTSIDMLEAIEDDIHVEVRKLYPDAELPSFETEREGPSTLNMTYRSPRPLAAFCQGLIEACAVKFNETAQIERKDSVTPEDTVARFRISTEPAE